MEPCPNLAREGFSLEGMITNKPMKSKPAEHSSKRSKLLGSFSANQMDFQFNIKKNDNYICDKITFYTQHYIKHNIDCIQGITVYSKGKLIGSYGNPKNIWCNKYIILSNNTQIERVSVKSEKVVEKIEFRLKVDTEYKLIEIGNDNDNKSDTIDILSENIYGFYGSFVRVDEDLNCLNTFGLIFKDGLNYKTDPNRASPKQIASSLAFNDTINIKNIEVFYFDPKLAGLIIGKKGSGVEKISRDFKCTVKVHDKEGRCEIYGPRENLKKARNQIEESISMYECEEKLHIQINIIGLVIGKNGTNFKQIYKDTNCKCEIDDTTGVCTIRGPKEGMAKAIEDVKELIRDAKKYRI